VKILRIFPHRNAATPDDELVRIGEPSLFDRDLDIDEVHVSVTFKWEIENAKRLASYWGAYYPVKIGGVALNDAGGEFVPGQYLKRGYVITSRGCPNHCWFCDVWKREGTIRELPITAGNNILDNNLLACSPEHIYAVFEMLKTQKAVEFTGGLEAKRLTTWQANELRNLKIKQMFFAYDTPADLEPLQIAGQKLLTAGFTRRSHKLRCFVLCGFRGDIPSKAEARMEQTMRAGFMPMAMYYRHNAFTPIPKDWHDLVYYYSSPIAMAKKYREFE